MTTHRFARDRPCGPRFLSAALSSRTTLTAAPLFAFDASCRATWAGRVGRLSAAPPHRRFLLLVSAAQIRVQRGILRFRLVRCVTTISSGVGVLCPVSRRNNLRGANGDIGRARKRASARIVVTARACRRSACAVGAQNSVNMARHQR